MKPTHHHRHAQGLELQGDVATARVLVGLHPGQTDQEFHTIFVGFFLNRPDGFRTDYPVTEFVPDDGLKMNVALGRVLAVKGLVECGQRGQGVIRLDPEAVELYITLLVVAGGFDEIDAYRAARFRLERSIAESALRGGKLKRRRRAVTAIAIGAQKQVEDHCRDTKHRDQCNQEKYHYNSSVVLRASRPRSIRARGLTDRSE